jgi:hypothetical protein
MPRREKEKLTEAQLRAKKRERRVVRNSLILVLFIALILTIMVAWALLYMPNPFEITIPLIFFSITIPFYMPLFIEIIGIMLIPIFVYVLFRKRQREMFITN